MQISWMADSLMLLPVFKVFDGRREMFVRDA
jgi:hypothetical protein